MPQSARALPQQHPALALLARETRLRRGPVPTRLGSIEPGEVKWTILDDAFLFRAEHGIRFLYRRGEGVTLECRGDADPRDIDLWLNGTVYAGIAALNGLFPLHASAVAHEGRVHAFTGAAGAGKSTLVAALGGAGFAHFCDDTMLLDLSGDGPPLCLPGHKRMKLWPEGVALAAVAPAELVASDYPKHFVDPAEIVTEPLPLAELAVLSCGAAPAFAPLTAGERIEALDDDHHTAMLWLAAQNIDRSRRFAELAALARRIAMTRFVRTFDPARFGEGLAAAAAHIRSFAP